MKKLIIPIVAVAVLGLAAWGLLSRRHENSSGYRFVEVTRGEVVSSVSSTGTLQATTTVEVGTQVSGKVAEIYVDFNDRVTKNQLIARIDPTILLQEVSAAEASLARSQAELDQTRRELDRMQRLYEKAVVTESEFTTAQYQHEVAQASYKSAQVNLERAQRNLGYTEIRAPISGVVVNRAVDEGQTVAASFSAPLLFLIAEDLAELEILASVDESDIGKIHQGQLVRFTVQAYPDETFEGLVRQVRLQSATQENVVSYAVVVGAENPDGRLLPGMTATVDFIVEQAVDVLKVPNAALRFRATEEMLAALKAQDGKGAPSGGAGQGERGPMRDSSRGARTGGEGAAGAQTRGESAAAEHSSAAGAQPDAGGSDAAAAGPVAQGGEQSPGTRQRPTMLWYLDANGKLAVAPAFTGITDGQYTEIRGPGITEGLQVIAAVTDGTATNANTANPFQQNRGQMLPRPPM